MIVGGIRRILGYLWQKLVVFLPDSSLKPLAAGIADSDVWEDVAVIPGVQGVCKTGPEGMVRSRGKNVVA